MATFASFVRCGVPVKLGVGFTSKVWCFNAFILIIISLLTHKTNRSVLLPKRRCARAVVGDMSVSKCGIILLSMT